MISDEAYESCLPVLEDASVEEEDKTEKLEELLQRQYALSGKILEDSVLSALWRYRDSKSTAVTTPPVRHTVVRRHSPAPWQVPRASTPSGSPALSRASPAPPPGILPSAFGRSRSYGGSAFSSPRPSPRLTFAAPIPHSPSLSDFVPSEPSQEKTEHGDYSSDTVDWLINDESNSRPSSSGAGSASGTGLNAAAADWIQPQQTEMSPHDMLRSVLGDFKSDEEVEAALEANGYDLSSTIISLMGTTGAFQQDQTIFPEQDNQILIGKSMVSSQPVSIDHMNGGRSTVICKYWLANGSCLRADCRFSHDLSSHICKYWLMGNCLAGESCIFSHDPSLLLNRMNLEEAILGSSPASMQSNLKVQDLDAFPTLNPQGMHQWAAVSSSGQPLNSDYPHSANSGRHISTNRRQFEPRPSSLNGFSSSYGSNSSRPSSRHRSREGTPAPSIPAVDDTEAFPSLSTAGIKGVRKHHGKRSGHGHGHGHGVKDNQPGSLADVVRMSSGPAPGLLRKGLAKSKGYSGNSENSAAANAIPPPESLPWLETGARANHEYLKARQEAFKHGGLRNKFLQSAAQAWNRNDARAAKALSLRGQSENDLMRKAHREAARLLYEQRNKDGGSSSETYVDLHGLHPEEAVEYLERALIDNRKSSRPVYAVTGTGHHSKGGKDKVGKAIRSFLNEWKYPFREFGMVGDNLGGILGIDPKIFDKSLLESDDGLVDGPRSDSAQDVGAKVKVIKEVPTGPRAAAKPT